MIRVIQRRLIIPRGDTGTFTVPALSPGQAGSVGVFTIFDPITKTRIFQKQVELQGNVFNIEFGHGDTVNLQAGDYLWDIKFYKNPIFADNKVIDGEEIDSYYAAFQTPKCEIRETGDAFMSIEGAHADIEDINLILAATQAANAAKDAATEQAGIAADKAEEATARLAEMIAAIPTKISDLIDDSGHYTKPASGIPASDLEEIYVKFDDYATNETAGVVKINNNYGIKIVNGSLAITPPSTNDIKNGNTSRAVQTATQHIATFYGLAKAAGSDEKDSELPYGQYTNAAKAAIQTMLDVPSTADIPTNVSELTNDAGYLTQHQDISGKANSADLAAVATSGSYEDLEDKPTIPDIQIRGTSIINNGIANIPSASNGSYGVVKYGAGAATGISDNSGNISLFPPQELHIKRGTSERLAITVKMQDVATFYGLSKAAGTDLANEENITVGTYPDSAKTAIQQMLGVPSTAAIPTLVSQLTNDSGYLTSFTETDPTVPSWAKAAQKPTYTAAEVGAPTVQEMNTAIGNAIGNINSFDMAVVQALPTQDISTHTIYLVPKTGETNDVYDEYVYINGNWEMVGNTQVDLSNYVQKDQYATASTAGIVSIGGGLAITEGMIRVSGASSGQIKTGTTTVRPLTPFFQHESTFYGLAKAAGDTTQSQSDNAIGTYTTEAKAAIRSMIGAAASADVTVQDVQVNGSSVLSNGIANIPIANENTLGTVRSWAQAGIAVMNDGRLYINAATDGQLKEGTASFYPIVPQRQHLSAFYGLAKAAGDTTQSQSNNAVGTYTAEAKAAILSMLGAAASSDIPDTSIYATKADTVLETTLSLGRKANSTIGMKSIALGLSVIASGPAAYAEGVQTMASGYGSHAQGVATKAIAPNAHAEGYQTEANHVNAHAEGGYTKANGGYSHVSGKYNILDNINDIDDWTSNKQYEVGDKVKKLSITSGTDLLNVFICLQANNDEEFDYSKWQVHYEYHFAEIIGNGTADDARSNAYALDWDGNGHYMGDIYVGANADSTGGTKVATVAELADKLDAADAGLKVVRLI